MRPSAGTVIFTKLCLKFVLRISPPSSDKSEKSSIKRGLNFWSSKMSAPQANEAEKNIEIWKVKKLIKRLEQARGNGTSMISLIIRVYAQMYKPSMSH